MESRDKELPKFPVFATNVSRDSFDFSSIIIHSSGYEVSFTGGAVDRKNEPLPGSLRVMVESEGVAQMLNHLYHSGTRHSTVTGMLNEVSNGSPVGIFHLLHGEDADYREEEKKIVDANALKKCFMKSFERIGIVGMNLLTGDELEAYKRQYDLLKKEGCQPINLDEIMALMKEEMPEIKKKAGNSIRELKNFNVRKRDISNN